MVIEKVTVYSDVHGNAASFNALINTQARVSHLNTNRYQSLGDTVGYYLEPLEAWQLMQSNAGNRYLLGNHDVAVARWPNISNLGFNETALFSTAIHHALWHNHYNASDILNFTALQDHFFQTANTLAYQYPHEEQIGSWRVVYTHGDLPGNPHSTEAELYSARSKYLHPRDNQLNDLIEAIHMARKYYPPPPGGKTLLCVGHTHVPMLTFEYGGQLRWPSIIYSTPHTDTIFSLREFLNNALSDCEYEQVDVLLLNVGSVGQPRFGIGVDAAGNAYAHAVNLWLNNDDFQFQFMAIPYASTDTTHRLRGAKLENIFSQTGNPDTYYLTLRDHLRHFYQQTNGQILSGEVGETYKQKNAIQDIQQVLMGNNVQPTHIKSLLNMAWRLKIADELGNRLEKVDSELANKYYILRYTYNGFFPR